MKKVCVTVILFILLLIGNAQQFNPIQVKGLPTANLFDLMADSRGFVWVAHDLGISRYDGNSFTHFSCDQQTGLAMTDMQEDKQGKIWCHNFNGQVFYINKEKMYLLKAYDNAQESTFPRMAIIGNELFTTSDHGLFICNTSTMHCRKLTANTSSNRTRSIAVGRDHVILAGDHWFTYHASSGLSVLKASPTLCASNFILQPLVTKDFIYAIENINGSLCACKLLVQDDSIILKERILMKSTINTISQNDGKILINTKTATLFTDGSVLNKGFDLSDIITDREGNHWYSSLQKGLLFERHIGKWEKINFAGMENDEYIKSMAGNEHLFVYGTNKGKIFCKNIETGKITLQKKIPAMMGGIQKIFIYPNNTLIIVPSIGLLLFNLENGDIEELSNRGIIKNIAFGDSTCLIAYSDSLTAFPINYNIKHLFNSVGNINVKLLVDSLRFLIKNEQCVRKKRCKDVCYDSANHILYASFMDGIFSWENNKFNPLQYKMGGVKVLSSLIFIENKIIVPSFNKKLFYVNKKQINPFTKIKGFDLNIITGLKAHAQFLYLTGTDQLQILDMQSNNIVNTIPMPDDYSGIVYAIEISGNNLYLAKPSGLYATNLTNIHYSDTPPPVNYLLSVIANNKKIINNNYTLNTEENNLVFTFAAPSYIFPEHTFFYYQLKGSSDSGWRKMNNGEHLLSFASLAPGNYILNAYAVNYRLQKAALPISFSFIVNKPWWQHLWFAIVLFAITTLFIYTIILLRFRYVRAKIKEKELRQQQFETQLLQSQITIQEQERKRIAEDLHDDIGATLSALHLHISNIPNSILETSPELQKFYAQSLSLASKAATDVRGISHDLLPKDFAELGLFAVLQNRIDELNATNAIQFTFIADGDEKKLDNIFCVTIYRIVNELISNIIKHSQAQKALIQILINETETQIIAEDNGIGILTEKLGAGIGMKNIQSRVSFLKGILNIDSNEKGTAIVITIPLNNG